MFKYRGRPEEIWIKGQSNTKVKQLFSCHKCQFSIPSKGGEPCPHAVLLKKAVRDKRDAKKRYLKKTFIHNALVC